MTVFFYLGITTIQGEGKLWTQTIIKIDLMLHTGLECPSITISLAVLIFETKFDDSYRSGFSDSCLHLYCYIHNVSADMSSGFLPMLVELESLQGTFNFIIQSPSFSLYFQTYLTLFRLLFFFSYPIWSGSVFSSSRLFFFLSGGGKSLRLNG